MMYLCMVSIDIEIKCQFRKLILYMSCIDQLLSIHDMYRDTEIIVFFFKNLYIACIEIIHMYMVSIAILKKKKIGNKCYTCHT